MLGDRSGGKGDGHVDHFLGSERSNVGEFVALNGHLARSAYGSARAGCMQSELSVFRGIGAGEVDSRKADLESALW
ncbi:MAG: hypothetical protein Q7K57_56610 [Burkholderiaceae bacterium]|nr:hypothetical protein [Burkholderiaceae bacterium]